MEVPGTKIILLRRLREKARTFSSDFGGVTPTISGGMLQPFEKETISYGRNYAFYDEKRPHFYPIHPFINDTTERKHIW
jgi:hypothetical protein